MTVIGLNVMSVATVTGIVMAAEIAIETESDGIEAEIDIEGTSTEIKS